MLKYQNRIQNCYERIGHYLKHTPLIRNERLSKLYDCNIFLKREDLQITRSFKLRGALNKISQLTNIENHSADFSILGTRSVSRIKEIGICTASAGNHAQGVAMASKIFNIPCDIFIPINTPFQKQQQIEHFANGNSNIILKGNKFDETLQHALDFADKTNKVFVHPFNDHDIIDGQATIAYEIDKEIEPDIIVVPVGGGGLISGISQYFQVSDIEIIGVEPTNSASMKESLKQNQLVKINNNDVFVEGASVKLVGNITFDICKNLLSSDKIITIDNNRVCYDLVELYQKDGIISETAGILSISALDKIKHKIVNKNVVCIVSGGNNDINRVPEIIERSLRYEIIQSILAEQDK